MFAKATPMIPQRILELAVNAVMIGTFLFATGIIKVF
jgi:hypothetical protein